MARSVVPTGRRMAGSQMFMRYPPRKMIRELSLPGQGYRMFVAAVRCCALASHSPSRTGVNALLLGRGLRGGATSKNG